MGASLIVGAALLAALAGNCLVESYRALPENLRECYSNDGVFVPALPLNLQVVVDIIRKLERRTSSSMSMRTLSAALIKRFKLDGVVFSEHLPSREGVLRFVASGTQRAKQRVVEELVPGDPSALPADALTRDERCLLHFALSNTVWDHYEAKEEAFCTPGPTERMGRSFNSERDRCPKEGGVVLTPFGTVALGSVVAAVAAALEPQTVQTKLLLTMPVEDVEAGEEEEPRAKARAEVFSEDEVDFVLPADQIDRSRSMWMQKVSISDTRIDNVWIATVSGELAEMVIYQGPIYEERMYLGAAGFWNSTIRPQAYYLSHRYNNFDATRAEIVGGVDGLIIAKNLAAWTKKFENLRLSQVLDMYYSEKGVAFDRSVKACQRGDQFPRFGPKGLMEEQTYAAAQVLAYLSSVAWMSDEALQRLVIRSVDHFSHYTDDHLFSEVQCRNRRRRQSRVQVLLAFDGSWTADYTTDFLAALVDDFDVSAYGSKMGLLHGETGEWLMNVTDSPSNVHQTLNKLTDIKWPRSVNLTIVFNSVLEYLDESWEQRRNNNVIGDYGQAIILLVPQITMTDEEQASALSALKDLKSKHPEVHFLYYTCESKAQLLKPFILSDEDHLVRSLDVDDISRLLSDVPIILRPAGCNRNTPGTRLQLEDYVNPSETVTYRLHPQWRVKTKKVTLTLHGAGYGNLEVCWWNQWTHNGQRLMTFCKKLSSYGDISMIDYKNCNENNECPNTYFQVLNVSTVTRCTEMDCKTPDQVRYIIRMESFECASSSTMILANVFLIIPFLTFAIF